jgi:hypothetical protein
MFRCFTLKKNPPGLRWGFIKDFLPMHIYVDKHLNNQSYYGKYIADKFENLNAFMFKIVEIYGRNALTAVGLSGTGEGGSVLAASSSSQGSVFVSSSQSTGSTLASPYSAASSPSIFPSGCSCFTFVGIRYHNDEGGARTSKAADAAAAGGGGTTLGAGPLLEEAGSP